MKIHPDWDLLIVGCMLLLTALVAIYVLSLG